jgi:hypothetical protein
MNLTRNKNKTKEVTAAATAAVTNSKEFDKLKKIVSDNKGLEIVENIDDERQATARQAIKERETHRRGEEEYYTLRNKWSWFIFGFVAFMLLFQLFVIVAIGYKWVDFTQYQTFLHLVIGENFAQIIGMGIIVAKFLFPKYPSHSGSSSEK